MDPKARLAELQQLKSERGLTVPEWYEVATLLRVLGHDEQAAKAENMAASLLVAPAPPGRSAVAAPPAASRQPRGTGLNREILPPGCITMLLAAGLLFYFAFVFDISVEVPRSSYMGYSFGGDRVNNIGLMQNRMIGIVFGLVLLVGGFLARLLRR